MDRQCRILFCDNEHGTGDVCFPDLDGMDGHSVRELFIAGKQPLAALRRAAKQMGWGRVNGGDYCPNCMDSM